MAGIDFQNNYFIFPNCKDEDFPFDCKEVIVFSRVDKYSENGYTHGLSSHAIKHYTEFEPQLIREYLDRIIEVITINTEIFLLNKDGNIIAEGKEAIGKLNYDIAFNTLDLINDKIMNSKYLLPVEMKIAAHLEILSRKYMDLIKKYIFKSIAIEYVTNLNEFIKNGQILKFEGSYNGFEYMYYLNFQNSGLIVQRKDNPKKLNTFFRIDKQQNSIYRISTYFSAIKIYNKRLSDFFIEYLKNQNKYK